MSSRTRRLPQEGEEPASNYFVVGITLNMLDGGVSGENISISLLFIAEPLPSRPQHSTQSFQPLLHSPPEIKIKQKSPTVQTLLKQPQKSLNNRFPAPKKIYLAKAPLFLGQKNTPLVHRRVMTIESSKSHYAAQRIHAWPSGANPDSASPESLNGRATLTSKIPPNDRSPRSTNSLRHLSISASIQNSKCTAVCRPARRAASCSLSVASRE